MNTHDSISSSYNSTHPSVLELLFRALIPSTVLALIALLVGCGGTKGPENASDNGAIAKQALSSSVSLVGADAPEVLIGSSWQSLRGAQEGVLQIKAGPRGSIVSIGESTLWMRSGSRVAVYEDSKGKPILDLQEGQLRYRNQTPGLVVSGDSVQQATASDLLLSRQFDRTLFVATDENPDAGLWSLELEAPARMQGVGAMEVRSLEEGEPVKDDWRLQLRSLKVATHIEGNMAMTEVEHIFYNDADQQMEGTFRFPAPDGVMVTGLAMQIGDRLMEGEFVERVLARQVYEKIVDEMQDPALLEWQEGGWFKLRVFPIPAKGEKRVILRYASPLQMGVEGYEYRYLATPPEGEVVGSFELKVNGSVVEKAKGLAQAKDVVVAFPGKMVPAATRSERGEYEYMVARLRPDFQLHSEEFTPTPRNLLIALDSSRSAIENKKVTRELLDMLLSELGPRDRFALFAFDIAERGKESGLSGEFVAATDANRARAMKMAEELEFDGASDLRAMFERAAEIGKGKDNLQVVYLGDGTPTWGSTDSETLIASTKKLGKAALHAAVVGRGASTDLWKDLTGAQGGLLVRPHSEMDARKFAFSLARKMSLPKLRNLRLEAGEGVELFPRNRRTVFVGDEMEVVLRAKKGGLPADIKLAAFRGEDPVATKMSLSALPSDSALIAKRWASAEIARMEHESVEKEAIVEMSRDFGVLSKHTSLLVLESEEAYKQHQIERKKREEERRLAAAAPNVTGGDLDNLDGRQASLSPDNIQPGDPEVRIPAPRDARSVVLIFPFGDTKIAHFDEDTGDWVARFLITPETADGQYWVRVNIEHKDGSVERMRLPYVVDTKAPEVEVRALRLRNGRIQIQVKQLDESVLGEAEFDASRVEVSFPWGQTARVYRKNPGFFRGNIRIDSFADAPDVQIGDELELRVVVTDEALNQRVVTVTTTVEEYR